MAPRYRLTADHFLEPDLIKEGKIVEFDGPPTPQMEPMNEEAAKRLEEYFAKFPQATISPVDNLSRTVRIIEDDKPEEAVVKIRSN